MIIKNLKIVLKSSGISQKELAARLNVSPITISRWANSHPILKRNFLILEQAIKEIRGLKNGKGEEE